MDFNIDTPSFTLRGWREEDAVALHAICSDPKVMEFLGPLSTRAQIDATIARQRAIQAEHGMCFWAIERKQNARLIGFCGLQPGPAGTPIEGKVEIGWRLAADCWGQGYARGAALAAIAWGWTNLNVNAIWAITVLANTRSWGLMQRLGMARHTDLDFDHPNVADGNPLKRHITWSIARPD